MTRVTTWLLIVALSLTTFRGVTLRAAGPDEEPAFAGAPRLSGSGLTPADIERATRGVRLLRAQSSGSGRSGSKGGLILAGVVSLAGGVGMLAYGASEYCKTARPDGTSDCGLGTGLGVTFLALGGLFLGWAAAESGQSSSAPQSVTTVPTTMPVRYDPPAVPQQPADRGAAQQAIDEIRRQPHGDLPPPQTTGSCSGRVAEVSVQNRTQYVLHLYLAGPNSQSRSISPSAVINLSLAPGSYDVGARVDAPNVIPFAGSWNLGGCSYRSQFYIG